jgi:hypothetical protein
MNHHQQLKPFKGWLAALPFVRANKGPARGTIAGALVVLERLKENYDLRLGTHLAPKGAQVKGTSGAVVKSILASLGEHRRYLSEGGRTNRGLRDAISQLLLALQQTGLGDASRSERVTLLVEMQRMLVAQVAAYHNQQRLKFIYGQTRTTYHLIHDLLTAAREAGKEGAVAQHLVGAKLQLRYPNTAIENNCVTTADTQLRRAGDFLVGKTAFHVTVAPMAGVVDKCRRNLADGLRAYLLVPQRVLEAARQMADGMEATIQSVESFVGQNVDEVGAFDDNARTAFARLLMLYNQRVDAVEMDKSLLIELPRNLPAP